MGLGSVLLCGVGCSSVCNAGGTGMTSPQPQPEYYLISEEELIDLISIADSHNYNWAKEREEAIRSRPVSSAAGEAVLDELVGDGWKVSAGGKGDSCIKCHDDLSPPKMQFSYPKNEALHAGILCVHCFADEYKAQLRQQGEACRDCYGSEVS
jgi:hypothetical protein